MSSIVEKLIYILLFGFNYKSKLIQNFFKAKRNNILLNKYYSTKKDIIKKIYNDKLLDNSIIINNFNLSKNFKQFIISKLVFSKFFNSILLNSLVNKSSFIFPLPTSSLKIIKEKVKVSFYFSKLIWMVLCFLIFFKSVFSFFCIIFFSKKTNHDSGHVKIYLDSLSTININKINFFYFIINKLNLKKKKLFFSITIKKFMIKNINIRLIFLKYLIQNLLLKYFYVKSVIFKVLKFF